MYNLAKLSDIARNLSEFEKDCAITVALKIADNSCKMDDYEKSVFMALYDELPFKYTEFFESSVFDIIFHARSKPSALIYAQIEKLREAGMEMITRPKMKAFKAELRTKLLD